MGKEREKEEEGKRKVIIIKRDKIKDTERKRVRNVLKWKIERVGKRQIENDRETRMCVWGIRERVRNEKNRKRIRERERKWEKVKETDRKRKRTTKKEI